MIDGGVESVRTGKCQNWKVSESVFSTYMKVSELESVRIGKCQNWKVSELESIRIGKCQNWKVSELENVRILRIASTKIEGLFFVYKWSIYWLGFGSASCNASNWRASFSGYSGSV